MQKRRAIACILAVAAALVMLMAAFPAFAGTATYVYDDAGAIRS